MKRKAVITLDFDAEDHTQARLRELEIRRFVLQLGEEFGDVRLQVTDRRPRLAKRAPTPRAYRPSASEVN